MTCPQIRNVRAVGLVLSIGVLATAGGAPTAAPTAAPAPLIPHPRRLVLAGGTLRLPATLGCRLADSTLRALVPVLDGEYRMLAGGRVTAAGAGVRAPCRLAIDPALGDQAYRLAVDSNVRITGGSYQAVAMGTVTLLQLLARTRDGTGDGATVPRATIEDRPSVPFRALLVDLGRQWHDVSVLEQLVELARWYKIGYVQLHLTDDQLFTFPTPAYPELPTPEHHYTRGELRRLDEFARARGVLLIPELEVPGHSRLMIERRPDLFGFTGLRENPGTINMGRERAYAALDTIVGEMADVFRASPYVHIGGDEATLDPLAGDPEVQRYMAAHKLADVHALYRHFLVRMKRIVERHGKRMLVWEGFRAEDDSVIPHDLRVMAWETVYQRPQDLLAGGYTILNVSWKPLYVTYQRKWPVQYIYDVWNLWRWENWVPRMPSYHPIQLDSTPRVMGAMLCAWEQPQWLELPTVRRRLAAMSERTWTGAVHPVRPYAWFDGALARTDAKLQALLAPVTIQARGLTFPTLVEGHYDEERWFDDSLVVALGADAGRTVRFTLDGSMPNAASTPYTAPIVLTATTHLRARAFDRAGAAVGYDRWLEYQLHPLHVDVRGDFRPPLDSLWEKLDDAARFTGTATIRLSSRRPGVIRYTLDGAEPTPGARAYAGPITVTDSATVRAQLFSAAGTPVGAEWAQRFVR